MKKTISNYLKAHIKLAPEPAYKLAQKARLDPNYLSKLINGIITVDESDPRVARLCELLNIPVSKAFQS